MLLEIPPCSTQSKNISLGLCFETCFSLLWGWAPALLRCRAADPSAPEGPVGPLQLPWVGAVTWPELSSSCTSTAEHPGQLLCILLPAPGAFPEAGHPLSGSQMRLAGLGLVHRDSLPEEISLLGSTCTQLMDMVQHGRDMCLGKVKAMRLFIFICLFPFHGNNELSLWSAVKKNSCPESKQQHLPVFVYENMETQESSSNFSYFSYFSTQERTPCLFFLCPFQSLLSGRFI